MPKFPKTPHTFFIFLLPLLDFIYKNTDMITSSVLSKHLTPPIYIIINVTEFLKR